MEGKEHGGKREEVPLERTVLSNMYSIEALIDVLVEKGLESYTIPVPLEPRPT